MKLSDILKLDFEKKLEKLAQKQSGKINIDHTAAYKEYDGDHAIKYAPDRQPETVGTENARLVIKAKEIITLQKKITETAIAFLLGEPPDLILNNDKTPEIEKAFAAIKDLWKQKKLDYFSRKLMRKVCIETEAAELWYVIRENDETNIRVMLLNQKDGYDIYPHFDGFGDMDAFTVKYNDKDEKNQSVEKVNIYLADETIYATKAMGGKWEEDVKPNPLGKIPVIYYSQDKKEWEDVQSLVDRAERMISGHADTNEYYAHPVLKLYGEILAGEMPKKEDQGKVLKFRQEVSPDGKEYHGDAEYLTWDQSPESLKLEFQNLLMLIHEMTNTPEITFEKMKGIGNITGIALRLLFLDPLIKAKNKQEIYGEGFDRRISIMKSILAIKDVSNEKAMKDLDISIRFNSILPDDLKEMISILTDATGGKAVMSTQTAVRNNPLVANPEEEVDLISKEKESLSNLLTGESFNI